MPAFPVGRTESRRAAQSFRRDGGPGIDARRGTAISCPEQALHFILLITDQHRVAFGKCLEAFALSIWGERRPVLAIFVIHTHAPLVSGRASRCSLQARMQPSPSSSHRWEGLWLCQNTSDDMGTIAGLVFRLSRCRGGGQAVRERTRPGWRPRWGRHDRMQAASRCTRDHWTPRRRGEACHFLQQQQCFLRPVSMRWPAVQ